MSNHYESQLKKRSQELLDIEATWSQKREALVEMTTLFADIQAYNVNDANNTDARKSVSLSTGHAISTWSAAMCLIEIKRTQVFIAGIIEAIKTMLIKTTDRPIHILDAGCGPYGILSLIPALYFSSSDIKFHLIDIIPENIHSVQTIIEALGIKDYFGGIHQEDATQFIWQEPYPLHIVISETMLNALRKEPQVAITKQLAPQLAPDGIFIPQEITIDLMMVDEFGKHKQHLNNVFDFCNADYETKLGTIMTLTRESFNGAKDIIPLKSISLPHSYDPTLHSLEFYTTIRVFGEHFFAQ